MDPNLVRVCVFGISVCVEDLNQAKMQKLWLMWPSKTKMKVVIEETKQV